MRIWGCSILFPMLLVANLSSCKGGQGKNSSVLDTLEQQDTTPTLRSFKNETCTGVVKKVCDGDTYDILLDGESSLTRVRMAAIDAPEKGQDFSKKSRRYLDSLIWKQPVTLFVKQKDSFGRLLAFTYLQDGREMSHEMVKAGYAWHYLHYDDDPAFDTLQMAAKNGRLGLWVDEYPIEPWIMKAVRRKGFKTDEIKRLKREGLIENMDAVKRLAPKEKTDQ